MKFYIKYRNAIIKNKIHTTPPNKLECLSLSLNVKVNDSPKKSKVLIPFFIRDILSPIYIFNYFFLVFLKI